LLAIGHDINISFGQARVFMEQIDKANQFASLHQKGDPLVLFNIWDAGSAKAVAEAGAKAIATGSWSVAAAHGYADGEKLPPDFAIENIRRIVEIVDLPVTLDFEGGYAESPDELKINISCVIEAGAVGINFEDQIVGGEGLYSIENQVVRIRAIREAADETGVPLFINARTDVFLKALPAVETEEQLNQVIERAAAYAEAGASGLFAPGLRNADKIRRLCESSPLPVNIFVIQGVPSNAEMAALGVARISYGPGPYRKMIEWLRSEAALAFSR
jgi:2-methylisocitrate lyase-like PEP mutase family enzyme